MAEVKICEILTSDSILVRLDNPDILTLMTLTKTCHAKRLNLIAFLQYDMRNSRRLFAQRPISWNMVGSLVLSGTDITDVTILIGVRTLTLVRTSVEKIIDLPLLETLRLHGGAVRQIARLPSLRRLYLYGAPVPELRDMAELEVTRQ
jgi:hypothetical protein